MAESGGQRPSNTANTTAAVVVVIRNPLSLSVILPSVQSVFRGVLHFRHSILPRRWFNFKKNVPRLRRTYRSAGRDSRGVIFTKRSETDDGNKMANGPFLAERQGIQMSRTICSISLLILRLLRPGCPGRIRIQSHHLQSAALEIHHSVSQTRPFFPKTDKVSRTHSAATLR